MNIATKKQTEKHNKKTLANMINESKDRKKKPTEG